MGERPSANDSLNPLPVLAKPKFEAVSTQQRDFKALDPVANNLEAYAHAPQYASESPSKKAFKGETTFKSDFKGAQNPLKNSQAKINFKKNPGKVGSSSYQAEYAS